MERLCTTPYIGTWMDDEKDDENVDSQGYISLSLELFLSLSGSRRRGRRGRRKFRNAVTGSTFHTPHCAFEKGRYIVVPTGGRGEGGWNDCDDDGG